MPFSPGDRLGPYQLVSPIGKGGMGEVWEARDPRLNRDVAIKIPAQQFSDRFEREAHAIAALNHPNICTLYDIGPNYLVMELIEGPTLAERMEQGAIPLEEALGIAKQVAEALEAAHEKAIVHRDLKPANIKIRPDGSVKVLDFGLAKSGAEPEVTSESPTIMPGGTHTGMIMGSAGYMSPEQARGQVANKRADIWAFGVVLYEMVTGKRLFDGETVSDSLVAILKDEPDLSLAPEKTRRLLARCLEKDPKKRLRDISAAEILLEPVGPAATSRGGVAWFVAGALAIALAVIAAFLWRATSPTAPETRVDIVTPATNAPTSFALSPDGRRIAFVASGDGPQRLWVRSLDSTSAQALPGTEGALSPFWSPDGRSLGFFANLKLERIDLGGGQPQTLADVATAGTQGAWSEEGVILFAQSLGTPLSRIPASGGQVVAATKRGNRQGGHRAPRFLPGGRQFLFVSVGAGLAQALWLGSLDGSEASRIATWTPGTESAAEYLAPGWLVRVRQAVLTAQRFDAGRGQLSGDPVTLAQAVGVDPNTLAGSFSVSPAGVIAWRSGGGGARRQLIWFNRAGQNVGTFGGPDEFNTRYPELSPDGKRVAVTRGPTGSADIWIEEGTAAGTPKGDVRASRFTFGQGANYNEIWSPDGARVVFASTRKGVLDLYQKPANGSGSEEILLQSADNKRPNSWSPDGRFILYFSTLNNGDLMVLPLTGDRKPFPFLSTPFNEGEGVFSPDGKWVAYQSNESGRDEIYVRPFPGPGGQWQVSTGGGASPRWRADGPVGKYELYYLAPDGKLMAVPVAPQGAALAPGTPEALFQTHMPSIRSQPQYDVARDGRFLIDTEAEATSTEPIHLLQNWRPPAK